MAVPFLFLILPQASCTGRSFTGLQLVQTLTSPDAVGVGFLVKLAVFALALACTLAVLVLIVDLFSSRIVLFAFRGVGAIGLIASLFSFLASGDRSLQGLDLRLEVGFWLVVMGFVLLTAAYFIHNLFGAAIQKNNGP